MSGYGKCKIKRIKVTKTGNPARIVTFTSRGANVDGNIVYFVHRYNPPEFEELYGKTEGVALAMLAAMGYTVHWMTGK